MMLTGWRRCRSPETVPPCCCLITLHCHDQCGLFFFNFATFLAILKYINTFFCCSYKAASSTGITEAHLNLQPVPGPFSEAATYTECLLSGLHSWAQVFPLCPCGCCSRSVGGQGAGCQGTAQVCCCGHTGLDTVW